jgi:integrase
MGTIRRRESGRYQARYRGPDGRERARTFRRKEDARAWIAAGESAKQRGDWIDPRAGALPFSEYAESWFNAKADVRPRTLINVRGRLDNYVLPRFGHRRLASIQPSEVREWVADLTRSALAAETVKAIYLTLAQVMRTAYIDRLIGRSPCMGIQLPKATPGEEPRFLSPTEVARLAETITPRYRAVIYTAAYAGLRAGEITALKRSRLDLARGTLDVTEAFSEVRGALVAGPTKTGKRRTLLIPQFLSELLAEHLHAYGSSDYVFTSARGGPVRHRNFSRRHFRPAVAAAGLPHELRFHDLRHTCAAILIATGANLQEVKTYLGHSSIRVTSDRYGHLFPTAAEAMRERLQQAFSAEHSEWRADGLRTVDRNGGPERGRQDGS